MKSITLPVRDFALPVPRTGSIDIHSGYARAAAEGREIHARIQKLRRKAGSEYEAEVRISGTMERCGYQFRIEGRMDGVFRSDPPLIEEIKSCFAIGDLAARLAENPLEHPYCLQLLTYGYLYWQEHGLLPRLAFHLVSTRSGASKQLEIPFDLPLYQRWLDLRLDELVVEARKAEKRGVRRRRLAADFPFPFAAPRPGQAELMAEMEKGMAKGRPMLIQAPTGLGKTVGVLYPVLKDALRRGQTTVYVTPKNSQHSVAEDAVTRFQKAGSPLRSLTITARSKMCLKEEPLCTPDFCEYAAAYYDKLQQHGVIDRLARKRKLRARAFRQAGTEFQVCPFELQLECLAEADLVICDYNYVFAPRSPLSRIPVLAVDEEGKPNLVVDEAHNLPSRAMDYYSPHLSTTALAGMGKSADAMAPRFRGDVEKLVDSCISVIAGSNGGGNSRAPVRIDPPVEAFREQDLRLRAALARYLESDIEVRRHDPLIKLCQLWTDFTDALDLAADPERAEFFTWFHPQTSGGSVGITCCDASAMLRDRYGDYDKVVLFSATLKPFHYYAQLSGIDPAAAQFHEYRSPFPRELRKLLIIPQISTRYSRRADNYGKIADAVSRMAAVRRGNYFVFFPSFEFLDRVADVFTPPAGFTTRKQIRTMSSSALEEIVEHLRLGEEQTIVFAVQGGSLAEGVDYAGEAVIGAFVVGPPLPSYGFEREEMRRYYDSRYGAGFEFAYAIPAMAKAIQAAGRVIRSETDRGIIVLMDDRFLEPVYSSAMPDDWFEEEPAELVSTSILSDLGQFWATSGPDEELPPAVEDDCSASPAVPS